MTEPSATAQPVTCKAVSYKARGGDDVIEIVNRTVRAPLENEVRIRVKGAAVNPTDVAARDPARDTPLPIFPGMDASGVVEAVGPGATRLRVGDEVMAIVMPVRPEGGAQASYIVVPEASVVRIPKGTPLVDAATLPMNGMTALLALDLSGLTSGQVLAVTGGAGWLAHFAIAFAKHRGFKVVADAKPEEADLVRGYGADIVLERGLDFAAELRKHVPEGADAILDTALLGQKCFAALRDGGVYLPVRGWGREPIERDIRVKPVWVSKALERTEWLELIRELAERGAISSRVTAAYPPEKVADAQRALSAGGLRGRPVITF